MADNVSNSRKQSDERKKLKKNMSLALDSIINRTTDDNTTVNNYSTITTEDNLLDNNSIVEEEEIEKDLTSPLDDILNVVSEEPTQNPTPTISTAPPEIKPEPVSVVQKPISINSITEKFKNKPKILKSLNTEPEKDTKLPIVNGNVLRLNSGDILLSNNNDLPITVLNSVPAFTHIPTYEVEFLGNKQLFKWYTKSTCNDLQSFRTNLEALFKDTKSPSYVLKPTIFTKPNSSGCFGCIYANSTRNYFTLRDIINGYTLEYNNEHLPQRTKVKFKNIDAIVNCSVNIAKIFHNLHSKEHFFYSFYEEDLLINIENGDVLLDISNAITRNKEQYILNKGCIYLAPELLSEKDVPNKFSDNYTLSVLLFRIFFHNHPLEGKAVIDDLSLDFKNQIKYYGNKATFIYDKNNSSNRPVRGVHYAVISMWEKYPQYIRDAFMYNFGEKLFSPTERYSPTQWLDLLLRLESDILPCVCGRIDFSFLYELTPETFYQCQKCGSKYHSIYFKKKKFRLPIHEGNKVYATFLKDNPKPYNDVIGIVQENKIHANVFGLLNVSKSPWNCTIKGGEFKIINPNNTLPIFQHFNFDYFGSIAEFDYKEN